MEQQSVALKAGKKGDYLVVSKALKMVGKSVAVKAVQSDGKKVG